MSKTFEAPILKIESLEKFINNLPESDKNLIIETGGLLPEVSIDIMGESLRRLGKKTFNHPDDIKIVGQVTKEKNEKDLNNKNHKIELVKNFLSLQGWTNDMISDFSSSGDFISEPANLNFEQLVNVFLNVAWEVITKQRMLVVFEKIESICKRTGKDFLEVLLGDEISKDEITTYFKPAQEEKLKTWMEWANDKDNGTLKHKDFHEYLSNTDKKMIKAMRETQSLIMKSAQQKVMEMQMAAKEENYDKQQEIMIEFIKKYPDAKLRIILDTTDYEKIKQARDLMESSKNLPSIVKHTIERDKKVKNFFLVAGLIVVGYIAGNWFGAFIGFVAWLIINSIRNQKTK